MSDQNGVSRVRSPKGATRDEWLSLRRSFVGASEAAALMHEHPYKSLGDLAAAKLHGIDQPDNAAMARGRALEAAVAQWWADEQGVELVEPEVLYVLVPEGEALGVLCATLDREIVGEPAALEVKTTAHYVHEPERYWYWQAQVQMLCTGFPRVEFAVLDASMALQSFTVEEHAHDQARVLAAAVEFWSHVRAGDMPPGAVPSARTLVALYPEPEPVEHELSDMARHWVRALRVARKREAECKADAATLRAMIEAELKGAAYGVHDGQRLVTLAAVHRDKLDTKRLRAEHPDLVAEYTTPATEHRLMLR